MTPDRTDNRRSLSRDLMSDKSTTRYRPVQP